MTNQAYQATVEALEAILSPRVVSRSLQEGLRQLGRSPDTVDISTLEKILKAQVYRQLQVAMPVTRAKQTVEDILGRLQQLEGEPDSASPEVVLERQGERLEHLRDALKPFNLYFEWPEVQKLRSQIQLLETEQEAEREAASLVDDAEAQLAVVEQKLEDQLVIQARELGELSEALEQVRTLGGAKVRRLESLVNQIAETQTARQLAPAEIDRARRLARDLRKLMESSVYSEEEATEPPAEGADAGHVVAADSEQPVGGVLDVEAEEEEDDLLATDTVDLDPEISARLLLLDLEDERHDLEALAREYADLLGLQPSLQETLEALRGRLQADTSIAEELTSFRITLSESFEDTREQLADELRTVEASLEAVRSEVDVSELRQALRVALGILSTTLPSPTDVQHVRNLHHHVLEQVDAFERAEEEARAQREAQLQEQAGMLERLQSTLLRYEGHASVDAYRRLAAEVAALQTAHEQQTLDPSILDQVRQAEASLESEMAVMADERVDRQHASLRNLLTQVQTLPADGTVANRISSVAAEIEQQLEQLEDGTLDDAQLEATRSMVETLKAEAAASLQRRLQELMGQAAELSSPPLLERIRSAMDALEDGAYPDLAPLRAAIKLEREAERSEQIGELHRLEGEAARFAGMEGTTAAALQAQLATARTRIDEGRLAPGLSQIWILLEQVRAEAEQRLRNVLPRLDAALAAFAPVEKLNSDDVTSVRRILHHLDSQRDALERVSMRLRLQLESSLGEAEALLEKLREEYEATRVIADQLVHANVLDDVLGLLGDDDVEVGGADVGSEQADQEADVGNLLGGYLDEPEVTGAALFSNGGELLDGRLPFSDPTAASLIAALRAAGAAGAEALGSSPAQLATLEHAGGVVVAAWPTSDHCLLVTLRSSSEAALLTNRLRRDLAELTRALASAHGGPAHT